MKLFKHASIRLAAALCLSAAFASAALAHGGQFRATINCNHEDSIEFRPVPELGGAVMPFLVLDVAGAGTASHMQGAVVCVSKDYAFNAVTNTGSAVFKFRDCSGDTIVMTSELVSVMTPDGPHAATFEGTWVIVSEACTGRFVGATGKGYLWGWANNDGPQPNPEMRTSGQGFAEYRGTLVLKRGAGCGTKK